MKRDYSPIFIVLFIITDLIVLKSFYSIFFAPDSYYICLGIIFLITLFYILYKLIIRRKINLSIDKFVPLICCILILLLSSIFINTAVRDLSASENPDTCTVHKTEFFKIKLNLFGHDMGYAYYLTGLDSSDNEVSFRINETYYNKFSYSLPSGTADEQPAVDSYRYSEDSEFTIEYLPVSKKLKNLFELTPSPVSYNTGEYRLKARIVSVIDDCTMEAAVTDTSAYKGSDIKQDDTILIQGEMTLLYPYNIQGFYEITEGDIVEFGINDIETGEQVIVYTPALNLVEE